VTPKFLPSPVPGKTEITITAAAYMAAISTKEKIGITTPVDEQESLLASRECICQCLAQGMGYEIFPSLVSHIYDAYLGQRSVVNAVRKIEQMKFTLQGIVIGGKGRGCRAHDYHSIFHFSSHYRRVSSMIAKTSFLLV
jgi:hypothetical protein